MLGPPVHAILYTSYIMSDWEIAGLSVMYSRASIDFDVKCTASAQAALVKRQS